MVTKEMLKNLNEHMNVEFTAAYEYLSMSAYCGTVDMNGFAKWFLLQAQEELDHAMRFFRYIEERLETPELLALPKPKSDYQKLLEVFETSLSNEQHVTTCINNLVDQALKEKDHATYNFLQWFVNEQVEEEASVQNVVNRLKFVGESKEGILLLDSELGKRTSDEEE